MRYLKGVFVISFSLLLLAFTFAEQQYVPGQVLVKFKDSKINLATAKGDNSLSTLATKENLNIKQELEFTNMAVLSTTRDISVEDMISNLESDPNVEYAEPNYIYQTLALPNDEYYSSLYAFPFFHWDDALPIIRSKVPQNTGVIVAVIDVGVDYLHPDLLPNMRDGSNCVSNTGVYWGSCMGGYDFVERDKEPHGKYSSHGSHVAGTIGAVMDNGIGVVGVNPYAKIMGIRAGIDNSIYTTSAIEGINFAIHNGAKVINASFGGATYSQAMGDAIRAFGEHGGLFVAGAGNDGKNHATTHGYPCDYDLDNIICVGSVSSSDGLSYFSDWSSGYIDILAPGESIRSTTFGVQTDVISEFFASINTGEIPSGWTRTGLNNTWGSRWHTGFNSQALSMNQGNTGYEANANFSVIKPDNLSNLLSAELVMDIACDTEYNMSYWKDYLTISYSSDGVSFDEIEKIDEVWVDVKKQYTTDGVGVSIANAMSFDIPSKYRTAGFTLKLGWVSNDADNEHQGCSIDNLKINKNVISYHSYRNMQGTSMSTPHVAGLASLVRGVNPDLTYGEVKEIIFDNSDYITGLENKVVTSSKINVNKTLSALISGTDLSYVSLLSSNSNPHYATSGDTISLFFSGNALSGLNSVYINGSLVEYTGNTSGRSASYLVTGSTLDVDVSFEIHYIDTLNRDVIASTTTDNSYVTIDTVSPNIYIRNTSLTVVGDQLLLLGSGVDNIGIDKIYVGGVVASGTSSWNQNISLLPGQNTVIIEGIDYAGNVSTIFQDVIRVPLANNIGSKIINANTVDIDFDSDIEGSGYIMYGTGSFTNLIELAPSASYLATLSGLQSNTQYIYKVYMGYDGFTGGVSDQYSFITPNLYDPAVDSTKTVSGSVYISGATADGLVFVNSGILNISGGQSLIQLFTHNLEIDVQSGTWDGLLNGPIQTSFVGTTPKLTNYTHIPSLTFKIGSDIASLGFTGTSGLVYPRISLYVGTTYNTKTLKIYKSEDNQSYSYISDCIVSAGFCMFDTDSFSMFTVMAPTTTSSGGGGGGGGGGGVTTTVVVDDEVDENLCTNAQLVCTDGKYVRKSGESCTSTKIGKLCSVESTGSTITYIKDTHFSDELNEAYQFAFSKGITTKNTIANANMTGTLLRSHLAKMISSYAINVLGKTPDTSKRCLFTDVSDQSKELQTYIVTSCQLGLMGQGRTEFNPSGEVTRAQFSTILSRLLYGSANEGGSPYYTKHISALKKFGIIANTNPDLEEVRGYVMLMLMRSAQ